MNKVIVEKTPIIILFNGKNEHRITNLETLNECLGEIDGKPVNSLNFSVKSKEFVLEEVNEYRKFPLIVEWVVKSECDKREYSLRETYHNWYLTASYTKLGSRESGNNYTIAFDYKTRS